MQVILLILSLTIAFIAVQVATLQAERKEISESNENQGPAGLQWVTDREWNNMAGGRKKNPPVRMYGHKIDKIENNEYGGNCWNVDDCSIIVSARHDGCWQGGKCVRKAGTFCYIASIDGDDTQPESGWTNYRYLVNPANSVKYEWVDWYRGKNNYGFPRNTVFVDKSQTCGTKVATYTDSNCGTTGNNPAQVDSDGYVYYACGGNSWDSNEYKLLVETNIKNYELLEINFEEAKATKNEKQIRSTRKVENKSKIKAKHSTSLSLRSTEISTWDHSISWNVGYTFSFGATVTAGVVAANSQHSFAFNVGGNHAWGTGRTFQTTATDSVSVELPPFHGIDVEIVATEKRQDIPYTAKVKITYDDGSKKTVTDKGTYTNVFVTNFRTIVGRAYKL